MYENPYKLPLYVFATLKEFRGVFPDSDIDVTKDGVPFDKVFKLPQNQGYACILGMGLMHYSIRLLNLLVSCRSQKLDFDCVVILGICGAFPGRGLNLLDVVRVDSDIEGDLGYQEKDGSFERFSCYGYERASSVESAPAAIQKLKSVTGVSVNCCTGTSSLAARRVELFDADVETMEGAAGIAACNLLDIPVYQVRAVSNMASDRDKSAWKIDEALKALKEQVLDAL